MFEQYIENEKKKYFELNLTDKLLTFNNEFGLPEVYLPVKHRVEWFKAVFPNGKIKQEMVHLSEDEKKVITEVQVFLDKNDTEFIANAICSRFAKDDNDYDFIQYSFTAATGKALALAGFGTASSGADLSEGGIPCEQGVVKNNPKNVQEIPEAKQQMPIPSPDIKSKSIDIIELEDVDENTSTKQMDTATENQDIKETKTSKKDAKSNAKTKKEKPSKQAEVENQEIQNTNLDLFENQQTLITNNNSSENADTENDTENADTENADTENNVTIAPESPEDYPLYVIQTGVFNGLTVENIRNNSLTKQKYAWSYLVKNGTDIEKKIAQFYLDTLD